MKEKSMHFNHRSVPALIFCLALLVLLLLLLIKLWQPSVTQQLIPSQGSAPAAPMVVTNLNQTSSVSKVAAVSSRVAVPRENFNATLALELLRQIAFDEQGYPIINNQLKRQLDDAVNLIGNERSPAELDKLSQLIKQTFTPATAETVEHILLRYYSYKIAEQSYAVTLSAADSINALKNEQTLSAMRESYLGQELAQQLFGEEKRYSAYVVELTEKLSAPDLSEEMRRNITAELQKKHHQEREETDDLYPSAEL
jgi:hypothetical protein